MNMRVNDEGYIERVSKGAGGSIDRKYFHRKVFRDWWLVKNISKEDVNRMNMTGVVNLYNVYFPKHLVGKRVKFRVIVLDD